MRPSDPNSDEHLQGDSEGWVKRMLDAFRKLKRGSTKKSAGDLGKSTESAIPPLPPIRKDFSHWRPENWVRNPAAFPDMPSRSASKWLLYKPGGKKYLDDWYLFLAGRVDEPPAPSSALFDSQIEIAQREHERRQTKKDDRTPENRRRRHR